MKDIIIPLQNCLGLPLQEKDVGTWEKELPSLYPSRKAHQLQDERFIPVRHLIIVDKYLPKASYNATIMHFHHKEKRAHTIPTPPPPPQKEKPVFQSQRCQPRILQLLGSESILAPKLLQMSFPTCCIPSFKICMPTKGTEKSQQECSQD